jgi:hypothetical protein
MTAHLRSTGALLAAGLSFCFGLAWASDVACALGAPRGTDRVTIAPGMVPRGEVSLVYATWVSRCT